MTERDSIMLSYLKGRKFTKEEIKEVINGKDEGYNKAGERFLNEGNTIDELNYELKVKIYNSKFNKPVYKYDIVTEEPDDKGYITGLLGVETKDRIFIGNVYCYFTNSFHSNGESFFPFMFSGELNNKNLSPEEQLKIMSKQKFLIGLFYVRNKSNENIKFGSQKIYFKKVGEEGYYSDYKILKDYPIDSFRVEEDVYYIEKELKPNENALFYTLIRVDSDTKLNDMVVGIDEGYNDGIGLSFSARGAYRIRFKPE